MVVGLCSKLVCAFLLDPSSFAQTWNSQTQSVWQERYEGTNTVVARSELDDDVDCLEFGSWESRFFVVYCLLASSLDAAYSCSAVIGLITTSEASPTPTDGNEKG